MNIYGKAIELKPDEARNYFSIAVIDWTEAAQGSDESAGGVGPERERNDQQAGSMRLFADAESTKSRGWNATPAKGA